MLGIPEVSTVRDGATARLVLVGEIDVNIAPSVVDKVAPLIDPETRSVIVDLSAVTFIDSAGVGALVVLNNAAEDAGIPAVQLIAGPPNVMRVLKIVGLLDVFDLHG